MIPAMMLAVAAVMIIAGLTLFPAVLAFGAFWVAVWHGND